MQLGLYDSFKDKATGMELPPFTVIIGRGWDCFHLVDGDNFKPTNYTFHKPERYPDNDFHRLAIKLEENILLGEYPHPKISELLIYLLIAEKGECLFVSDIESEMHPKAQAMLLEGLAILSTLGVNVLITTYSPYIMAHLNNIMHRKNHDISILQAPQQLYLQDYRAFRAEEKIGAYEIKDGQLISLHDPNYGIRWDTLSDVSVELQQKYFAIHEHLST